MLTAELTARKKQYEFYRDKLLSFDNLTSGEREKLGVRWTTLGDIGTFTRGRRFVKTDLVPDGIPCMHYGEMYTYYGVKASKVRSHIRSNIETKLRFASPNDIVIVAAGETVEDIGVGVAWLGDEKIAVHDACFIYAHNQNPRYISHFLRTSQYHKQIVPYVSTGKISSLSETGLKQVKIPLVSLQEQEHIANLLDTLDSLIKGMDNSIPAEIEARKRQYEYYRDKILAFGGE